MKSWTFSTTEIVYFYHVDGFVIFAVYENLRIAFETFVEVFVVFTYFFDFLTVLFDYAVSVV